MSAALRVEGLHKQFRGNHVLRGTSFEIRRGRITALIGSNGAGKSTLLNVISGLTSADAGRILLNGRDITHDTPYRRARGGIARTFQHPRAFRSLDVRDCVRLGATAPADETLTRGLMHALRGFGGPPVETATLDEILQTCRLARRAGQRAADLSYSEQKLLMLAQVMASNREILCFDELCAGLEPGAVGHVADIFCTLSAGGKTVLFVEHNLQLVRDLADWVIFLHEGITYREGLRDAVLGDPDVIKLYLGQ
jgi:ABC-type branched-subunit amino acid transport system ATPase component